MVLKSEPILYLDNKCCATNLLLSKGHSWSRDQKNLTEGNFSSPCMLGSVRLYKWTKLKIGKNRNCWTTVSLEAYSQWDYFPIRLEKNKEYAAILTWQSHWNLFCIWLSIIITGDCFNWSGTKEKHLVSSFPMHSTKPVLVYENSSNRIITTVISMQRKKNKLLWTK